MVIKYVEGDNCVCVYMHVCVCTCWCVRVACLEVAYEPQSHVVLLVWINAGEGGEW